MLAIVVCLSQRADGASWSLVMAGTQALVTSAVFVLAAGSVGALEPSLLLFPVYFCLFSGGLALLILNRRAVLRIRERLHPSRGYSRLRPDGTIAP